MGAQALSWGGKIQHLQHTLTFSLTNHTWTSSDSYTGRFELKNHDEIDFNGIGKSPDGSLAVIASSVNGKTCDRSGHHHHHDWQTSPGVRRATRSEQPCQRKCIHFYTLANGECGLDSNWAQRSIRMIQIWTPMVAMLQCAGIFVGSLEKAKVFSRIWGLKRTDHSFLQCTWCTIYH